MHGDPVLAGEEALDVRPSSTFDPSRNRDTGHRHADPVDGARAVAQLVQHFLQLRDRAVALHSSSAAGLFAASLSRAERARASSSKPSGAAVPWASSVATRYANERNMPATSRSGIILRRRSAMLRAGSPSKSVTNQSSSNHSTCPRCRSPCVRIKWPPSAVGASLRVISRSSSALPTMPATESSSGSIA